MDRSEKYASAFHGIKGEGEKLPRLMPIVKKMKISFIIMIMPVFLLVFLFSTYRLSGFNPKYWLSAENSIPTVILFGAVALIAILNDGLVFHPIVQMLYIILMIAVLYFTRTIIRKLWPIVQCPRCGYIENRKRAENYRCLKCRFEFNAANGEKGLFENIY